MNIGTHIHKSKAFLSSLMAYFEIKEVNKTKPVQIFSGGAQFWRRPNLNEKDVTDTEAYVKKYGLNVYIHSIFLINLCRSETDFKKNALACLLWELETGVKLGFKGVVVHCGKSLKMEQSVALENMYCNIRAVLPFTDPKCPLLLETSSGQGTETCWQMPDFIAFYSRFSVEERTRLKICIDTCHVFAAGHDPEDFILSVEEAFPNSIVLVHFNDSKEPRGQRKDRHARPGKGHIGLEKMTAVARWCFAHNIPMVME